MYKPKAEGIEKLLEKQEERRLNSLNLIASENSLSKKVRNALSSDLGHRYAEGEPFDRFYAVDEETDEMEIDVANNFKKLFNCKNAEVRPISGTIANDIVFSAFVKYNDIVIVNSTNAGGHISHYLYGAMGSHTKNILQFPLAEDGFHIDVEKTRSLIYAVKPSVIVLGKSLFLFPEPIKELKEVCKNINTKIIYDASHVLGLVAGKQFQNPLEEGADIVTASTHKTFPGTQRGVILSNIVGDEWEKIKKKAFPGKLSNHHLNTLAGLAIAAYEMLDFAQEYAEQIIKNAKILANSLYEKGVDVKAKEFGFTETHQLAIDVAEYGGGKKIAHKLQLENIFVNKNLLPFETLKNLYDPAGVRIGVQEMTRFGMKEQEMLHIAELVKACLDGKNVKEEVIKFRKNFQDIKYGFDSS